MLYIEVIPMQDESESKKLTKQLYHYVQKILSDGLFCDFYPLR